MESGDVAVSMIWLFFWLGLWFGICALVGNFAKGRGHQFSGYFWLSVFLSPLIGLIGVLIAGTTEEVKRTAAGDTRKCPHCAEMVKPEAKVCRYCQRDLPPYVPPAINNWEV